jgi:flagellar biosynthetic protein FliP
MAVLALSVVPSLLLMTTCFVRFSIVLTLVRQALGTQQLPPNSVLMALALFLSCLVMEPVWRRAYQDGMRPYLQPEPGVMKPDLEGATIATLKPLREFMSSQIELAGNSDTVWVLLESRSSESDALRDSERDLTYDDVPLPTLAAAFVLSELKVGFVIGFQILLPFLVIDLVVGLVLSMLGLTAISHGGVALPFKLLLFVLVDGWTVIVGRLLASVAG